MGGGKWGPRWVEVGKGVMVCNGVGCGAARHERIRGGSGVEELRGGTRR